MWYSEKFWPLWRCIFFGSLRKRLMWRLAGSSQRCCFSQGCWQPPGILPKQVQTKYDLRRKVAH